MRAAPSLFVVISASCFSEAEVDPVSTGTSGATISGSTSESTTSSGMDSVATLDTGPSSSGDAASTSGSSSGEPMTSHALLFDGGLAGTADTTLAGFDDAPFTIELWISSPGSFEGVLFDTTINSLEDSNGMFIAVGEEYFGSSAVAFQNLGVDAGVAPVLFGPESSAFAGWHHLAVTHQADGTHRIWFDGHLANSVLSTTPIDNVDNASINIGSRATTPFPPLMGVLVDDLRLSNEVIYTTDFEPQRPLPVEESRTLLLWTFDEGEGGVAVDAILGMEMSIDAGVSWVAID